MHGVECSETYLVYLDTRRLLFPGVKVLDRPRCLSANSSVEGFSGFAGPDDAGAAMFDGS